MHKAVVRQLQDWFVTGSRARQVAATLILCLLIGLAGGALFAFVKPVYAVVLLVALAGGLAMLSSTQLSFFALAAVICLLPFAALPGPDIGFTPTVLDLVLVVLLVIWLFRLARRKQPELLVSPLGLPVVVFLLLVCASFVMGLSYGPLTTNLLRHFVELLLNIVLFFIVINNVDTPQAVRRIVSVLIVAGLASAAIGIVLYFLPQDLTIRLLSMLRVFRYPSGSEVLRYIEDNPELALRATSTSIDPNVLGGLLVVVAALTVPQLLTTDPLPIFQLGPRWRGINLSVLPVLGVMLLCILLTYSRSAFVGLGLPVLIMGLTRYRKLLFFVALAGLVILLLPQTQGYVQRFLEGLRGEDLATQMRFGEYKDALTLIGRHPWFGVGFAGAPDIDVYIGVSNLYLLIAEETGLVGLGVFMWIVVTALLQIAKGLGRLAGNPAMEAVLWGLLGALLGVLFSGVFDHYFFNINFQHAVALFWFCLGLAMAVTLLADQPSRVDSRS